MAEHGHGTRQCYQRGCRRDECKAANREFMASYRAVRRGLAKPTSQEQNGPVPAPVLPTKPSALEGPGEVERATLAELETLSAAKSRLASVARAVALARILDQPKMGTTHPSAARQHAATMDEIRAASTGRAGRLASVSAMAQRQPKEDPG